MKRLRRKKVSLAHLTFDTIRMRRRVLFAEWVSGDINDPNLVQQITDIMASGGQMQIEYNGEWKTIEPYGWNSSNAGNVLLMCYKDTGEVRSYRLDRMTNVQFDSSTIDLSQYGLESEDVENLDSVDDDSNIEIPTIEDDGSQSFIDEQQEIETPFDDAIDVLEQIDDNYLIEDLRQVDNTESFEPVNEEDYDPTNDGYQQTAY
ncbi:gp296 [Bacillus phage G]|uniref:Gp296 n=1 Tax=Bacillus phage G TaxID=2884420 RepID=G3MA37_9CAUD|nr:gp296 [Bacillus phage G]AEO93555.1 gp296 [Bacillus phage G]